MIKNGLSIVCSMREHDKGFEEHVKKTIGLKNYELIFYINPGTHSLTELYNKGLNESKNKYVLFCHNDIKYLKSGWGKKYIEQLEKQDFGIIGHAGTTKLTESGRWWDDMNLMVGQVWHQHNDEQSGKTMKWESKYSGNFGENIIQTINLDGLAFCVNKDKIKEKFHENIKGFHFYDLDFTLANHLAGVKVGVMFGNPILHKSIGMTNEQWETTRQQFVDKWLNVGIPLEIKPDKIFYENKERKPLTKEPKLAVVIPSKNNYDLLERCVKSLQQTKFSNYKIYIADTGSLKVTVDKIKENLLNDKVVLNQYGYYNFSKINNDMVSNFIDQDSELVLFCNDDVYIKEGDPITRMTSIYVNNKHDVGTIGLRLHFGERSGDKINTVQHGGVIAFTNGEEMRITHQGLGSYWGYEPSVKRDVFGNTFAFAMTPMSLFKRLGKLNEIFDECFEDVEFNLKCILNGKTNFFIGDEYAIHDESSSRNKSQEKLQKEALDYQKILKIISGYMWNERLQKLIKFINKQ
jgi:glycosyltransferase involved in cell wall biosynthesis